MATIVKVGERFRVQVRIKGFPSVAKTFDKKGEAKTWGDKTEAAMRNGGFSDARHLATFQLSDLIDRYIKEMEEIRPFGNSKHGSLRILRRHLGTISLAALTDDAIVKYARKRSILGAGGVTIGLDLTYLGNILRVARTVWKIPFHSQPIEDAKPTLKILKLIAKSNERDRRPTDDELVAIRAFFDGKPMQRIPMSDIIRFAIATAMRLSEITSIRWDDVDEAHRTVLIRDRKDPQRKIGNNQTVPLLGESFGIAMRQKRTSEFIFPYKSTSISCLFPKACKHLGIIDLHFHDLRHEGVSRLFEQGYRIEQVALVSGHKDWKMLRRYTQVRAKDLHRDLHDGNPKLPEPMYHFPVANN